MHNMARPFKMRKVDFDPNVTYFKPRGVPLTGIEEIELSLDELESLRLANLEKFSQIEAAAKMDVHQSTFHRILTRAREKVTDALVHGKAIKIQDGPFTMKEAPKDKGGPELCKCPKCGHTQPHLKGQPCAMVKCEKCSTLMVRGDMK